MAIPGWRAAAIGAAIRPVEILTPALKILASGAALIVVVWWVDAWGIGGWLGIRFADNLLAERLLRMVVTSVMGGVTYLATASLLGLAEMRLILPRARR